MKNKIILSIALFLFVLPTANALEAGYPFFGRVIDQNNQGIPNVNIQLDFEECISKKITTNSNGEFILTLNGLSDIIFKENNITCITEINPEDSFSLVVDASSVECGIIKFGEIGRAHV